MSLITSRKGNELLAYHPGMTLDIPDTERHIPMPLALVGAKYQGKTLFIFNTWRKEWELPGGIIEPGEAPHETALRELMEESNQQATAIHYAGWMKFRLKPDDRLELAVLYTCELMQIRPFIANDEAEKIMFWDLQSPITENYSEIDAYLAGLL